MSKCKCCGKEISPEQARWSGLCPCCDLGLCEKPEEYHKLEKRLEELEKIFYEKIKKEGWKIKI